VKTSNVEKQRATTPPLRLRRRPATSPLAGAVAEERADRINIPVVDGLPVEIYSPERKAEFLLSNAINENDYQSAVEEVRKMGLDPSQIDHYRPTRRRIKHA
jgi:hypothetical protein